MIGKLNDSPIRQYRPKVGQLFQMSAWSDYTERGLNPWTHLRATGIDRDVVSGVNAPSPLDRSKDGTTVYHIPLHIVQMPIGWEPRYTIHCKPDRVETVLSWFKRGIVVRQSHNLGGTMPTAFQPLTEGEIPQSPHWQFPEATDVIPADNCSALFRVVSVEEEEITSAVLGFPPDPACNRCNGAGRDSIARVAAVRGTNDITALRDELSKTVDDLDSSDTFRCSCHYGALSRMARKDRTKLFDKMKADGWDVWYEKHAGGYWMRRRETIVHDWEPQPKPSASEGRDEHTDRRQPAV